MLWYSIKAVAERRGGQTEKRLEKNKKVLDKQVSV